MHTRPFQAPYTFSPNESTFRVGLQLQRCPAMFRSQGAGGSPHPPRPYAEHRPRGETRNLCFPEQTRIGAELGFPRRVPLSRMQLPETSFVPFLSWFSALASTSNAPVHRQQEAAQTLLVPMASNGLGGKPESAAFLSKHALGLSLVSRGEFHSRECSCQKLDL